MNPVTLIVGLAIIAAAVYAVMRKVDVRLALLLAALLLGIVARQPAAIVQKFLVTFSDEKYVVPICSAMGFAYVLRHTGCDQHLVQLLCQPLRRARVLLIPGAVFVGFVVNIPIISQTSTAVAIGSVLIPLMFAAGVSPVTAGAAILLGSSIGGELLNPGAPEYATVRNEMATIAATPIEPGALINHTLPLVLLHLLVATAVFWWLSVRADADGQNVTVTEPETGVLGARLVGAAVETGDFRVNLLKAAVPLVPLALLFLTSRAFSIIPLPQEWLVGGSDVAGLTDKAAAKRASEMFDSRLIGAAMLAGVLAAALTGMASPDGRRDALGIARAFFEGAGYAFAEIIAIIVAATCFAEGVKLVGVGELIGGLVLGVPGLLVPAAGLFPLGFAALSGSGMAATQGLYGFFTHPAIAQGVDPLHIGSIVSIGAAAGRTMSPVAAVVLMAAKLTGTNPVSLVKRVAPPLLAGVAAMIIMGAATAK